MNTIHLSHRLKAILMRQILTFLLLSGLYLSALCQQPKSPIKEGDMIPEINKATSKGEFIELSQLDSKLIIVDFWASWCGPCIKSHKTVLKPLYEKYSSEEITIIGISNDKKKEAWENAISKYGMPWHNIWDDDQSLVKSFGVPALPTYFIIDNQGKVLASNVFSGELEKTVKRLLKDETKL